MGKRKGRQLETEFMDLTDQEVLERAADRTQPKAERRRYQRHAKALGLRNRRKRDAR